MSKNYRAIQCHCADENYSESAGSDSDDASDTHESTAEMQKVDAQESLIDSIKSTSSLRYTTFRDPSEKSSAVEVLKKIDADRKSRISVQNLKLSLIFPKMFWKNTFESFELLPTGSSFEIKFDTIEEEFARSLRFRQLKQKVARDSLFLFIIY
ncbi:hypothetical protein ACS0PU_002321 [Formica fusca]